MSTAEKNALHMPAADSAVGGKLDWREGVDDSRGVTSCKSVFIVKILRKKRIIKLSSGASRTMVNFKHLHYFWVAARAGGIMRASEQLNTTAQTLSGQIKLLETRLGQRLFRKSGRQLELTEVGKVALGYADQIFALGAELENAMHQSAGGQKVMEFRVGVAESVAKSVVYRLLAPAMGLPEAVRLVCSEGKFGDLLAQLGLQRLDLVLADEPITGRFSVKAFNHPLGSSPMSFFCAPKLRKTLKGKFPQCLNGAPLLLQGQASSVRRPLEAWLERQEVHPRVVGEFDDLALMKAFGREGRGLFMSASVLDAETVKQYGVDVIGRTDEIVESFFAVSVERRITHPCVVAITQAARDKFFAR